MCFCLMLCLSPEVTHGLSFALFLDSLLKGKDLLHAIDIFWLKTNIAYRLHSYRLARFAILFRQSGF